MAMLGQPQGVCGNCCEFSVHAHKLYHVAMERKDGHTFERVKKLLLGAIDTVLEIATGTNKKWTESSLSVGTAGQSMVLVTQIAQGSISRKKSPSPVGSKITLIQGVWSLRTFCSLYCVSHAECLGLPPLDPGSCSVCLGSLS